MRNPIIVDVSMRDGFQSVGPFIPTETKLAIMDQLYSSGVRRIEATSFVSPTAVPQLADASIIVAAARSYPDLDAQVLAPTVRQTERALEAGANHIAFVLSVTEAHNVANVRRTPSQSVSECREIASLLEKDHRLRINVATAFDCPFTGKVPIEQCRTIVGDLLSAAPEAEIALCDTTGRATPDHVSSLFAAVRQEFPEAAWAFHGHDTYGMGAANVWAAWQAGVDVVDASAAGLGGCPFAPGATGNVASEDIVWMFGEAGVSTGIDLDGLLATSMTIAALPDAQIGGRVRSALAASSCAARSKAQ